MRSALWRIMVTGLLLTLVALSLPPAPASYAEPEGTGSRSAPTPTLEWLGEMPLYFTGQGNTIALLRPQQGAAGQLLAEADDLRPRVSKCSAALELQPGPPDHFGGISIVPSNTIRNCGDTAEISAFVYDRFNNPVEDGTQVVFGVAFDLVRVSPNPALTRNGVVVATIASLNKPLHSWPKSHEQIGMASGSALPSFVDLWIEPGPPTAVWLSADPLSIPINGVANFYDIIVEVEVNDCSGTPITDTTSVTLQTDTGLFRESGTWAIVRPSINGMVTATLTSEERAGQVTISATVDSIMDATNVTFLPDEPFHVDVWGVPFNITADGHSRSQVTAWVRDYYYNPVLPGITLTFVSDHGHWFESSDKYYTTTTSTGGYAFATLVSSSDYIGTVNIYALTYNGRLGPGILQFVAARYFHMHLPLTLSSHTPWRCSEPSNDTREGACGPVLSGVTYRQFITSPGDEYDYFYLDMPSPGRIEVRLTRIAPDCDYDLYLEDATGELLQDSAGGPGADEHIEWGPGPSGRYYVAVTSIERTWSASDPYELAVTY